MSLYKIIFAGSVGAGKTTAIGAISDIEPFTTEEVATDQVSQFKKNTTVAMDYGQMTLDSGQVIHLYGTPGQERFDFMWEILTEGGIGLILLINNEVSAPLDELVFYLDQFESFIQSTGVAIGVTHTSVGQRPSLDDYARVLQQKCLSAPVMSVDARQPKDVVMLTQALLYSLDPGVQ